MPDINDISIFGEYNSPENRITSALLHIFKAGGEDLIRYIFVDRLNKELPENKIEIISQDKQGESIPDGTLKSSFKFQIFIESKIRKLTNIDETQLNNHLKSLVEDNDILLYLTSDDKKPYLLTERVLWTNWTQIDKWLEAYSNKDNLLEFLYENFDKLLRNQNLIAEEWNSAKNDRVVIVAGCKFGEEVAKDHRLYFCQNERSIKPSGYIGFYCNKQIKYCFKINKPPKNNENLLDYDGLLKYFQEKNMIDDKNNILDEKYNWIKSLHKIFELGNRISIKKINHEKRTAFTQFQRYTEYSKLINATTTDEL